MMAHCGKTARSRSKNTGGNNRGIAAFHVRTLDCSISAVPGALHHLRSRRIMASWYRIGPVGAVRRFASPPPGLASLPCPLWLRRRRLSGPRRSIPVHAGSTVTQAQPFQPPSVHERVPAPPLVRTRRSHLDLPDHHEDRRNNRPICVDRGVLVWSLSGSLSAQARTFCGRSDAIGRPCDRISDRASVFRTATARHYSLSLCRRTFN